MEIKILHWYYDILNLYGEYGNIKILEQHLKEQGFEVLVDQKTIDDVIDINDYDVIYLGSGTERNLLVVNEDIKKYRDVLKNKIEEGMVVLATGNSHLLFGNYILPYSSKDKIDTLGIFEFSTEYGKKRIQTDVLATCEFLENTIVGFVNTYSTITTKLDPLFHIYFSQMPIENDGIRYMNFFGTSILGPILVHNPEFLRYLVITIASTKLETFNYKEIYHEHEIKTYDIIVNELKLRSKK